MFTESLTIRILGDSSGFRSELEDVLNGLDTFRQQLSEIQSAGERLGAAFRGLSGALKPLQAASQLLSQVTQQVHTLSQTPITLNIQPALSALQALSAAISAVMARMTAISFLPGMMGGGAVGGPLPGLPPKYAAGGLVTGPLGTDAVPALLTAGEFVLNREAVAALGTDLLTSLNRMSQPAVASSTSTTNHFGGITIQVQEAGGVNDIVRDLRLQGIHLRNRRG